MLGGDSPQLGQGVRLHPLLGPATGQEKRPVVVEGRVGATPDHKHEVLLRPRHNVPLFHLHRKHCETEVATSHLGQQRLIVIVEPDQTRAWKGCMGNCHNLVGRAGGVSSPTVGGVVDPRVIF